MRRKDGKFRSDSKMGQYFDAIVSLYQQGISTNRLETIFGIDRSNIYRNLKSRGILVRGHSEAAILSFDQGISKRVRGCKHHSWKGGRRKHSQGYVMMLYPTHHRANSSGYVGEHILVAENTIGRKLLSDEDVHHKNRKRDDNRPDNLQVMKRHDHKVLHGKETTNLIWMTNIRK